MPTTNNTNHDADYHVGPPPPAAPPVEPIVAMLIAAGAATAMFFLSEEPSALLTGAYLVTLVSLGVGLWFVSRTAPRKLAAARSDVDMVQPRDVNDLQCPALATEAAPRFLASGITDPCPASWPVGHEIVFTQPNNPQKVWASAIIPAADCHIALVDSLIKNQHGQTSAIQFTIPAP